MKATSKYHSGGLYGNFGPNRATDPTPEEIRQRCAEVRAMRQSKGNAIERMVLAAIATTGPMSMSNAVQTLGQSRKAVIATMLALAGMGVLQRRGGGSSTVFMLPDSGATEPGLISNDEAYRRVTRRRTCVA